MKFAALIEYIDDREKVEETFAAHRVYLRGLLESGRLFAAGPLADDRGALWVYDADTVEDAEAIIKADPAHAAGVIVKWQIHRLAYWSAKECKGSK